MTRKTLSLDDALYTYLLDVGVREAPLLRELRQQTANHPMARMQISAEQGALFTLLTELLQPKRCLEVGVFTGYSALAVALALPDDGQLIACDIDPAYTDIARRFWQRADVAHKIDLRLAPAVETLDGLLADEQDGSFDFAFLDADKENYENYYQRLIKLLRPGGLLAVDNVLWSGRLIDDSDQSPATAALRAFNLARHSDERVSLAMLPISDGVSLLRKR